MFDKKLVLHCANCNM